MNYENMSAIDMLESLGLILKEFKIRRMISKNRLRCLPSGLMRDISRFIVTDIYNQDENLPNLSLVDKTIKTISALNHYGERYAFCMVYGSRKRLSSVVRLVKTQDVNTKEESIDKCFEKLVVCKFNDECQLELVCEYDWEKFLTYSRKFGSSSTSRVFELSNKAIDEAKIVYKR